MKLSKITTQVTYASYKITYVVLLSDTIGSNHYQFVIFISVKSLIVSKLGTIKILIVTFMIVKYKIWRHHYFMNIHTCT